MSKPKTTPPALGHQLVEWYRRPWRVCLRCGLVTLKNEATRRALKVCPGRDE